MMSQNTYDRITFSLPHGMNVALDSLKEEIKTSKSDIIKMAIEYYIENQKRLKLQKAVELMESEYENNSELTAFTTLDSETFL